jgi:hypothetical protein
LDRTTPGQVRIDSRAIPVEPGTFINSSKAHTSRKSDAMAQAVPIGFDQSSD